MADSVEQELLAEQSRNRIIGAVIWLGILIVIVPVWYSNPINFKPAQEDVIESLLYSEQVVSQPFILPDVVLKRIAAKKIAAEEAKRSRLAAIENKKRRVEQARLSAIKAKQDAEKAEENRLAELAEAARKKLTPVSQYVWILRVAAYRSQKNAEALRYRLSFDYQSFTKYFPESKYYSVRIGPLESFEEGKDIEIELNRMLRVKSELVKIVRSEGA